MAGPPNNQYAVLGSRLGFRLNYLTAAQKAQRVTWATFLLDGLPVKVRYNSVTIHDIINDTPDTCALTIDARTPPNVGQRLTVRINTDAPRTLFAGPIQTVGLTYEGKPNQTVYPCQAIDDTPLANRKLPYGQWVNTSATTIGQWLVTTFCPAGFSSASVQAGLPPVSVNFDATEGMDGCLRQVAKLIGGYFYWEDKILHLFQDGEPGDTPDPITVVTPYATQVATNGATHYWRLGEVAGLIAVDSLGAVPGTIAGGVTLQQSGALMDGNAAMLFNSALAGQIIIPPIPLGPVVTIETWVRTTDRTSLYQVIFSNRSKPPVTGQLFIATLQTGGSVNVEFDGTTSLHGTRDLGDGNWHHIVCVTDGTTGWIYVDGALDATAALTVPPNTSQIGISFDNAYSSGTYFNGGIDEVAIYPVALTAAQIAAHYAARTAPPVASHWLHDPPISVSTDTSQVRTRTYGKGYAEEIIADVAANETIVPITNAVMFNPAGGQAVSETQRLRYTGTVPGGGGTVVGPGVTPSSAPTATVQPGAGVTAGAHDYAVTFATAAGESLPGPRVTATTGLLPPPATAPTVQAQPTAGGNGPDAGGHYYAVSFVTASGETVPGPQAPFTQPTIAAPSAPVSSIFDSDTLSGYAFPGMAVGNTLVISYTYSADPTDRLAPFPANGETSFSPPSAGYVLKQAPGKPAGSLMNFAFYTPFATDPNVKWIHFWFSINAQPRYYGSTVPTLNQNRYNMLNQPAGGTFIWQAYAIQFDPSKLQPSSFNPIVGGAALTNIPIGPAGVTGRKLWRTKAAQFTPFYLAGYYTDNTTTTWTDTNPDNTLVTLAPTVGTAAAAQVQLSGIPLGAATVTGRKVYRTAAGVSQLKLLATLADNTTVAYLDVLADASLGANVPTGDTSGIQQPAGSVLAGAATIIVAGAGWASAGGGWAVIGNGAQVIRYTGISGNTITGIPATGPGAIVATISYNSTITAAAALLGVTGLLRALIKGAPINLWVQRDDLAAQAAVALDGTDGIIEHLITDERRGELSLSQLCDADLAQYSTPIQTVPYATRDVKTKSGKPITFALASPAIYATLTIQDVTITEINLAAGTNPRFTVTASSVRFSLEDMLRRLGASLDVTS